MWTFALLFEQCSLYLCTLIRLLYRRITPFLCCGDQVHEYLSGLYRFSHKKVAKISGMAQTVIKGNALFSEIGKRCHKDCAKITVHNPAVLHRYNIIETTTLMHTECQRSIFICIPKRKFHLIAVGEHTRAVLNWQELIRTRISDGIFHHATHLFLFDF